jgi:5-methylcytosine-specific restriction endonuclease McrA
MSYNRKAYLKNKVNHRLCVIRWRLENAEKVKLKNKEYREAHKEERAAAERQRRARKRNLAVDYYTVQDILDMYGNNCHICEEEINLLAERKSGKKGWEKGLHIDHLVPLRKGGTDTLENVRPAHGLCNLRKGIY